MWRASDESNKAQFEVVQLKYQSEKFWAILRVVAG